MPEVLAASLTFPSVIFTGVLALAMIYWLFVILGALDLDLLGGADADVDIDLDGVVKGGLEGATKGALEGAVKGSLEGAAKGAAEGMADVDSDGGLAGLFAALQLNRAPATVVLTLLATFGWLTSVLVMLNLTSAWATWGLPGWLLKIVLLAVSLVVALVLTSIAVRPLAPLFEGRSAQSRKDLIGRVCVISTGRVNERFGQATLEDGGAGLILDVRCDTPDVLRQGDRALLVSWDDDKDAFVIEPMEDLLAGRQIKGAARRGEAAVAHAAAPPPAVSGEAEREAEGAADETAGAAPPRREAD